VFLGITDREPAEEKGKEGEEKGKEGGEKTFAGRANTTEMLNREHLNVRINVQDF
jgi:hypothetical protein